MICLYFGSFNPIHWGHIGLGQYAYKHLGCKEVWFVASPLNPHKSRSEQWPYVKRVELIKEAIAPYPYMKVEQIEQHFPQPLYTWRTIRALKLLHPQTTFALLIGSDNLIRLKSWKKWQEISRLTTIYVYPRPGYNINTEEVTDIPYIMCSEAEEFDISSTMIRASLNKSQDIST